MDNLRLLTTFIRIANAGNFSRAARELGITPQAASNHIKHLEEWVGVRLFNRTTRKISLTEEGTVFYETCTNALNTIDQGVRVLHESAVEVFGTVRIAVPHGLGWRFVAPSIGRFLELHPRVSVELIVQNQVPDVINQGIDVGIMVDPVPDNTMVVRKFATTRRVLCASPEYLKRYGTPKEIEELSQHRCINMRNWVTGKIMPWTFRKGGHVMTNDVAARLVTTDGDCELQAALSGAGIAQLTTYRVAPYVRSKQLQLLLTQYASDRYNYYIYMPRRKQIPKKNRALADFLFRELREHPDLLALQTLSGSGLEKNSARHKLPAKQTPVPALSHEDPDLCSN